MHPALLSVGFHPFDPRGDGTEQEILANMKAGKISFDDEEWTGFLDWDALAASTGQSSS